MTATIVFSTPPLEPIPIDPDIVHGLRRVIDKTASPEASIASIAHGRKLAADLWEQYSFIRDLVSCSERTLFGERISDIEVAALTGKPSFSNPQCPDSSQTEASQTGR